MSLQAGRVEAASTLALLAVVVAAFILAARSGTDWGLRRSTPAYASRVFVGSVSVAASSEATLLDIQGGGQVEGLTVKFTGITSTAQGELRIYVDGASTPDSIFMSGAVALFLHGTTVDVGRFARPLTVTVYDTTNNVYGFSITAPIRFSRSIRITVYNYYTSSITVNYAIIVSLEK